MTAKKQSQNISRILFIVFIIACAVNLSLAAYIMIQKNHNDTVAVEQCFLGDGGCYTVQTSAYAKTFGIANPHYGYFFFSVGILLFAALLVNTYKRFIPKDYLSNGLDLIEFFLVIGAIFSLWLLYAQFFLLGATCKYCVAVDIIMIAMAILFSVYKKKFP